MASCFLRARRGISNIVSAGDYWTALRVSLVWPHGNFRMAILVCTKKPGKRKIKSGIGFSFSIKRMRSVWKIYYRERIWSSLTPDKPRWHNTIFSASVAEFQSGRIPPALHSMLWHTIHPITADEYPKYSSEVTAGQPDARSLSRSHQLKTFKPAVPPFSPASIQKHFPC